MHRGWILCQLEFQRQRINYHLQQIITGEGVWKCGTVFWGACVGLHLYISLWLTIRMALWAWCVFLFLISWSWMSARDFIHVNKKKPVHLCSRWWVTPTLQMGEKQSWSKTPVTVRISLNNCLQSCFIDFLTDCKWKNVLCVCYQLCFSGWGWYVTIWHALTEERVWGDIGWYISLCCRSNHRHQWKSILMYIRKTGKLVSTKQNEPV